MTYTSPPSNSKSLPPWATPTSAYSLEERRFYLEQALTACRTLTLKLLTALDPTQWCFQAHPDFSPVGWHFGHIAYTESLWLLEHCGGQPSPFPAYRHLFAADGLPKSERGQLPSLDALHHYLGHIRTQTLTRLKTADLGQEEFLWHFILQHESQHCETITLIQHLLATPPPPPPPPPTPLTLDMVCIPAGDFIQGSNHHQALDNERPAHVTPLPTYWIDRYPVTCGQYRQFIQANGYQTPHWWTAPGWQWVQQQALHQPLYWIDNPRWDNHPVCGVSGYEAQAYATFAGKRLPTEAEWEKAARWHPTLHQSQPYPWGIAFPTLDTCNHGGHTGHTTPVNATPAGQSPLGCHDLLGNVWEWTRTPFHGYPGFTPAPYPGYSQTYFDNQHWVLKGGSWATRPWALRSSWRNWYAPTVRQIFAGFRCVQSEPSDSTQ